MARHSPSYRPHQAWGWAHFGVMAITGHGLVEAGALISLASFYLH